MTFIDKLKFVVPIKAVHHYNCMPHAIPKRQAQTKGIVDYGKIYQP